MTIRTHIDFPDKRLSAILEYTWRLFAQYIGFEAEFSEQGADIVVGSGANADVIVSQKFVENIQQQNVDYQNWFDAVPLLVREPLKLPSQPLIPHRSAGELQRCGSPLGVRGEREQFLEVPVNENERADYLGTCFYLINCLQEYNSPHQDKYGRFPYNKSLQHHFNCVEENLVAKYFDLLFETLPFLKNNINKKQWPSRLFLSHDIDHINGAWKEEGKWAFKRGRFDIILKLLLNQLFFKPDWLNMDKIMKMETEYDFKSTFFWLVNQDEHAGIKNADYNINSKKIRRALQDVSAKGFENGLHKSSSPHTYENELKALPAPTISNRNHYLKINIPQTFAEIEKSALQMDCSLGFAEKIGFRNSYGLPFQPFNLKENRPYNFLEVPLHIMDATLLFYHDFSLKNAEKCCLDFLEKHSRNAVISVLWHNSYFSNHKFREAKKLFKKILEYARQKDWESNTASGLINEFRIFNN